MKVLLPAVSSARNPDGVSRHAANLTRCLLLSPEVTQVDLIVGEWQRESMQSMLSTSDARLKLSVATAGRSTLARNWWYWHHLPRLAEECQSDVVHVTYPVPLNRSRFDCPLVATLHDLYAYDMPANFGYPKVFANRAILQQCLRAVDSVACVSESTLRRLDVRVPWLPGQKAVIIYNCVLPSTAISDARPFAGWEGEQFLLCVAQHRRNKNVILALQVFQQLLLQGEVPGNARLLIIGIEGPETKTIRRFLESSGIAENVTLLQGLTDAELKWCYSNCELMLATSSIEGFGLSIVEAMLQHCRIVCSDIPAFREVGGSYCEYASLEGDVLAAFIEAARGTLRDYKFRHASTGRFDVTVATKAYMALYSKLRSQGSKVINLKGSHPIHLIKRGEL